jgi:hypothetical protein
MMYFFSEVFFIYTGQKFKNVSHYLVVVNCASKDDDGRSSDFCLLPPPKWRTPASLSSYQAEE